MPIANIYTIVNFATQTSLTEAILNERRLEFAGEGRRWPNITRLSQNINLQVVGDRVPAKILVTALSGTGSNYGVVLRPTTLAAKTALPYTDNKYIWPIPTSELNANPNLPQNPGY